MPPLTGLEICWEWAFLQRCRAYGAADLQPSRLAKFLRAVFSEESQFRQGCVVWQMQLLACVCAEAFGDGPLRQLCFQPWRKHQTQAVVESNQPLVKGRIVKA